MVILRFLIIIIIGLIGSYSVFFINLSFDQLWAANKKLPSWQIPFNKWDRHLFENVFWYIIEGKAAGKVFLGDREEAVLNKWGKPLRRSYESIEIIEFHNYSQRVEFSLERGFVKNIRFYISPKTDENFFLQTALGFSYEIYSQFKGQELRNKLISLYDTKQLFELDNKLIFYGRGISYGFYNNKLDYVEIYYPRATLLR